MNIEEITKYDKKLNYHKIILHMFMVIMGIVFVYNLVFHGPMWKIMTALLSISILILMVIIIYVLKMIITVVEDMDGDNFNT